MPSRRNGREQLRYPIAAIACKALDEGDLITGIVRYERWAL